MRILPGRLMDDSDCGGKALRRFGDATTIVQLYDQNGDLMPKLRLITVGFAGAERRRRFTRKKTITFQMNANTGCAAVRAITIALWALHQRRQKKSAVL